MLKEYCEKYFFLIITSFVLLGFFQWDFSIALLVYVKPMLGIVIFMMALTLEFKDFKPAFKQPKALATGIFCQYFFMPLIAFCIAKLMQLPNDFAVGLILMGSSPGGAVSNVMAYIAKADLALSITMTFVSTLIAPLMIPLMMWIYASQWIEIDAKGLFITSIQIVLLPLIIGLLTKAFIKNKFTKEIDNWASFISIFFVTLIVHTMVASNVDKFQQIDNFSQTFLVLIAAVILHNAFGYLCGYYCAKFIAKLEPRQAKTISIEVGVQNSGLASVLALLYFNPLSVIPSVISASWHSISGSALANHWAKSQDVNIK
jgi:bile acid:Na+ symporter, BASS family